MHRPSLLLLVGALAHPVAAPLTDLLFDARATRTLLDEAPGTLAFFGAFAFAPMAALAGAAALALRVGPPGRPLRWMLGAGAPAAVLLSLAAQVLAWSQLRTDAQAALLFVFTPFAAAAATVLVALAAGVTGVLAGAPREEAAG